MKQNYFKSNKGITGLSLTLVIILILTIFALIMFGIYIFVIKDSSEDDSENNNSTNTTIFNYNNIDGSKNTVNSNNSISSNNSVTNNLVNSNSTDDNYTSTEPTEKSSSSLNIDGTNLTFKVPSGFYSLSTSNYEFLTSELFVDSNNYVLVDVKIETTPLGSPEDYLESQSEFASEHKDFKTSGVKSLKVSGKEFKYIEFSYVIPAKNDGSYLDSDVYEKYIYAIYDISENKRFCVSASTLFADKIDISIDTIKDFLDISGV